MDLGLKGRRALVMGASKGLGRAIAESLAAEGAGLVISGRDPATLAAASAELLARGARAAHGIAADVADGTSMDRLADGAVAALGGVDILVLNHGGPPPCPALEMREADLVTWFQRIVVSPIRLATRLLPAMRERHWGRLITVGSTGMVQPLPNLALSNTLRGAIVGWNKTLALEVAGDGVTCNIMAPGGFRTDRVLENADAEAARTGADRATVIRNREAAIPLRRFGEPREFGPLAAFLCSEHAAYITGSILAVDGGIIRGL